MNDQIRKAITDNMSYKFVALFITLILWLTVLGKRDFNYEAEMKVSYRLSSAYAFETTPPSTIKVFVRAKRKQIKQLKKFLNSEILDIRVPRQSTGRVELYISEQDLGLPDGLRVLKIEPHRIEVQIKRKDG